MCRFACTTYGEKLFELRTYVRRLSVEELDVFLIKMETLGDTITDLTPPVSDTNVHEYEQRLRCNHVDKGGSTFVREW